jgi:hypothetical protein
MDTINSFEKIYKILDYDRVNNPSQLSVGELMPVGIKWIHNNIQHQVLFATSGIALPLNDGSGIAISEDGYSAKEPGIKKITGRAYILNADNTLRVELSPQKYFKEDGYFGDIYYINNRLSLFFGFTFREYRMVVDEATGNFLEVAECR